MKPGRIKLWSRFSFTTKILVVFLPLPVVSLATAGALALVNLHGIGNYSPDRQESPSDQAVQDSTKPGRESGGAQQFLAGKDRDQD